MRAAKTVQAEADKNRKFLPGCEAVGGLAVAVSLTANLWQAQPSVKGWVGGMVGPAFLFLILFLLQRFPPLGLVGAVIQGGLFASAVAFGIVSFDHLREFFHSIGSGDSTDVAAALGVDITAALSVAAYVRSSRRASMLEAELVDIETAEADAVRQAADAEAERVASEEAAAAATEHALRLADTRRARAEALRSAWADRAAMAAAVAATAKRNESAARLADRRKSSTSAATSPPPPRSINPDTDRDGLVAALVDRLARLASAGFTDADVGLVVDCSPRTVRNWRAGKAPASDKIRAVIAAADAALSDPAAALAGLDGPAVDGVAPVVALNGASRG